MKKKYFKHKQDNESGQALVTGLIFLIFTLLCSVYFLFFAEAYFKNYSQIQKVREQGLKKASLVAHALNQISMNNQNIIASLAVAQNAFAEAAEIGLYVGFTQPYWDTYGVLNKKKTVKMKSKESYLSSVSSKNINILYTSLQNQTARGLFVAKSLHEKNKKIVALLPQELQSFFIPASNANTFCFALETQEKYYKKPGFHNIFLFEHLYRFYLEKENCVIKHVPKLFGSINVSFSLLSSSETNTILSYKNFDVMLKKEFYGIWYVNPKNSFEFLKSTLFYSVNSIEENPKFTVIAKFLDIIPFFKNLNLSDKTLLSGVSKKIKFRITHPYFICTQNNNWNGDFLKERDFENISQCSLSEGQFIKSFFYPKWTPLISQEENKNAEFF
ncbi:hypothetical protein [Silvanigrella aquatica]|uniref:Uncharacterized protein n=1 Tax=Silvanigrella aquatica TaxID=1915309 RepID=A0A1L4D1K3_9BACT|nr:hypothetical protein [Silvanigrella aquatica]APJ04071.1 hypothetical protein AXG55_09195 [Silvanigrella aquatica]